MTKCQRCKNEFPDHLYHDLVTSEGRFTYCPICALELRNEMSGLPEGTPFQGEIANRMWEEAKEFLEDEKCKEQEARYSP